VLRNPKVPASQANGTPEKKMGIVDEEGMHTMFDRRRPRIRPVGWGAPGAPRASVSVVEGDGLNLHRSRGTLAAPHGGGGRGAYVNVARRRETAHHIKVRRTLPIGSEKLTESYGKWRGCQRRSRMGLTIQMYVVGCDEQKHR